MDVLMPQLGETVAEGKILTWFKQVGDDVAVGDDLFEIETDKVTMEVQAIAAGRLSEIRVHAGTAVKVGAVVGIIESDLSSAKPDNPDTVSSDRRGAEAQPLLPPREAASPLDPFNEVRTAPGIFGKALRGDIRMTPLARRLAQQSGIALKQLLDDALARGESRIQRRHVESVLLSATQMQQRTTEVLAPDTVESLPLNAIRQRTGERLTQSWRAVPHVFQAIEIDFSAVEDVRTKMKQDFHAQSGTSLTYLPFIARAVCLAIRDFPHINGRLDGDILNVCKEVNLGIAVDLSHAGLVVPVVRHADGLSVRRLAMALARQVSKARAGQLKPDDMAGATYTISNNGSFGTMFTAPIVNAPQVAILSTDAVRKRPAVVTTSHGEFIMPRPMGIVVQSFDHRAFDGAYSAAYLSRLKAIIETRNWSTDFD